MSSSKSTALESVQLTLPFTEELADINRALLEATTLQEVVEAYMRESVHNFRALLEFGFPPPESSEE